MDDFLFKEEVDQMSLFKKHPHIDKFEEDDDKVSIKHMFNDATTRRNILVSCVIWSCAMFNFYLVTFYLKYFPGSIITNNLYFAVVDSFSFVLSGHLV